MLNNLKALWGHIPTLRRKQFSLLLILMILASFAEIISIGAVLPFLGVLTNPEKVFLHPSAAPFIEFLELSEPEDLILPLTVVFSLAAILSGALRLTLLWVQTRLSNITGAELSINIYRRTLYQPYSVHVQRNSGEVIAAISQKTNEVINLTLLPTLIISSSTVMLVTIMLALFFIQPVVAISAFAGFAFIYLIVIGCTRKILQRSSSRVAVEQNRVIKILQEGLGGIRDVLIDGSQETYCEAYRNADVPLRRSRANIQIISGSPRFGIEAFGMVLIALLALFLSMEEGGFSDAIPVLGALALGAQRLLPALQQAYANWALLKGGQASLKDTLKLLDQPYEPLEPMASMSPISYQNQIQLNNISYRYIEDGIEVLKDINLTIEKGSRVGFIGTTGSGKSTLLDILMGLLRPSGGSLTIDGETITEKNQRAWQKRIAHVPQSIFLADTTVAHNIAMSNASAGLDLDKIRNAAFRAQIAETIEKMDLQYDTQVGERGVRLSGGQRQRIGIARAFYKDADVIVFDEATSALDGNTESLVMDAVSQIDKDVTVMIVAHRLSTLKDCSQIVELDQGKITRIGTYNEIIAGMQP